MWLIDNIQGLRNEIAKLSVSCARPTVDDVIEPIAVNSAPRGAGRGCARKATGGKERLSLPFKRVGSPHSHSECAPTATPSSRSTLDDDASTAAGAASDVDLDATSEISSHRHSQVAVDLYDSDNNTNFSLHSTLASVGRDGLLHKVSHVLQRLANSQTTSASAVSRKHLVHFNCATPPSIGVQDYLQRLMKWMNCTDECVILALIYIDRLEKHHPNIGICRLNIHRILSTALVLAAKFQDDEYRSNAYYAKVAGVSLDEMNQCEEDFLGLLKWSMHVSAEEFEQYVALLFPGFGHKNRH